MFHKVNAKERVIGWYSTGPKLRDNDLSIHETLRNYTAHPVLVIIDVNPADDLEIPTQAYISLESAPEEKSQSRRTFKHIPCKIGATEPEEVGVEHLLREIKDIGGSTISELVSERISAIRGYFIMSLLLYSYLIYLFSLPRS
jgi:26S proteasome regulatory subunit N8